MRALAPRPGRLAAGLFLGACLLLGPSLPASGQETGTDTGTDTGAGTALPATLPPSPAQPASGSSATPGNGGFVLEPGALPPALGGGDAHHENALRRFEIIALGSFPFTLFYTGLGFDTAGYVESGFDAAYAPWPFKNERSVALTSSERLTRLGVAAGASLLIAGIDALIRGIELRRAAEASRRLLEPGFSGDSRGSELDSGGGPH